MIIAFHKPFGVLSQFTSDGSAHQPLAAFDFPKNVYPVGRLDADSEGLLILSDEKALVKRLLHPRNDHERTYWAQVEHLPAVEALGQLCQGVEIRGYRTKPCEAAILDPQPDVAPRDPPIRVRQAIPDCWISLRLTEGKNRQVRRMCAAVGHPVLRLMRVAIGAYPLGELARGEWRVLTESDRRELLSKSMAD